MKKNVFCSVLLGLSIYGMSNGSAPAAAVKADGSTIDTEKAKP